MGKPPAQAKAKGIEKSSPQGNSKRGKSVQVDSALQDSLGEYLPSRVNAFDGIVVKGAKEHNLKNVSVKIPRNKITVLTGLSGSGKSSLAFDTIYAEGQRRYIESLSAYARQFLEQLKKPDVELITGLSPAIAIDQKSVSNSPRSTVGTVTEIYDYLRLLFAKIGIPECPIHHVSLTHSSPQQMADEIRKLKDGTKFYILAPMAVGKKGEFQAEFGKWAKKGFLKARVDGKMIDLTAPPKLAKTKAHDIELVVDQLIAKENMKARLAESINTALSMANGRMSIETTEGMRKSFSLHTSCPQCGLSFPELEPRLFSFNNPRGACQTCNGLGTSDLIEEEVFGDSEGGSRKLEKVTYHRKDGQAPKDEDDEESFEQELRECPDCKGARIKPEALSVKVNEKNIHELSIMSAQELDQFMGSLKFNNREALIAEKIIKQIRDRLAYMIRVGTSYLSLHRSSRTLSGGEAQRLRLATQVGSSLIGVLYVMDEPSIGLHPRDHRRLLEIIGELRDRGNTIILVEHDEDTIRYADHVIDIGPRAGKLGGVVMAEGTVKEIQQSAQSLTGKYLRGEEKIDVPKIRRPGNGLQIALSGATGNNLNNVDCNIPLGKLVAITGVSGSGKSTLIIDTFYKALAGKVYRLDTYPSPYKSISGYENVDKVIEISQRPIGRTPRSTPATYVGLLPLIRDLYAQLPEAKIRGYEPGRFSFNVKGGRCETCMGHGQTKVEMHFLSDVFVTCEACNGRRYNRETLNILYNGKSISDVLDMTVAEALDFFKNHKHIHRKLETLHRVGLDYIHLGQSSVTISGGEAQRVKLSKELSKRATGKTVYILDEPTTGLHFGDIKKLIELLHELTDQGNTVVVIEHHLDVIKNADWVIDMGPDGGKAGGTLVGAGTPEDIVKLKSSITGSFLNEVL